MGQCFYSKKLGVAMIDVRYGKHVPVCDSCEEELPMEDSWGEAVTAMEEASWKYYPSEGTNLCQACQEDL